MLRHEAKLIGVIKEDATGGGLRAAHVSTMNIP